MGLNEDQIVVDKEKNSIIYLMEIIIMQNRLLRSKPFSGLRSIHHNYDL